MSIEVVGILYSYIFDTTEIENEIKVTIIREKRIQLK